MHNPIDGIRRWTKYGGVLAIIALGFRPLAVFASSFSLESIGSSIGLGNIDLKASVLKLLNLILGFLPLIAVTMVIFGGFLWLTAAGNEERVDKAKKTISAALIGMVLVLLAWAIVLFVTRSTANVTSA